VNGERYMLDTNVLVDMLRGLKVRRVRDERRKRGERICNRIERELRAGAAIHVSMVTVCELEHGVAKADNAERERRALYKVLAPFALTECDAVKMPRHYGEVRRQLEMAGQPIGAMDLMIAAHALAVGATLVTNNTREFAKVKGLRLADWAVAEKR
jgi:tRNA(fMet)-specific endonuclease VapC